VDSAPVSGLGRSNAACNTRYHVDGVQFNLVPVPVSAADLSDKARLRNRLAYQCFGAADKAAADFLRNAFGRTVTAYGRLDSLRPDCLTDAQVPLALVYQTAQDGLIFVDEWAVRRRVTRPAADDRWLWLISDRRLSEAEAMFLQFEAQVEAIRARENNLSQIRAVDRCDYLPPAGLLPLTVDGAAPGLDYHRFFEGLTGAEPAYIAGARLPALIQVALSLYPPIDVAARQGVRLYRVIEAGDPAPFVAFTTAFMPPQAEPRYDVSAWDYANHLPA
jgi:hypothetical protein